MFLLASSRVSDEPPSVVDEEDWREKRVGFVGTVDMIAVVRLEEPCCLQVYECVFVRQ